MKQEQLLAWCAGYLEQNGTWWLQPGGELGLSLRADNNASGLERFALALDLTIEKVKRKKIYRIRLEGTGLKMMLQSVWPYLTHDKRSIIRAEFARAKAVAGSSMEG